MNFSGKTAISTGGASGMGHLFAQNFAALGGNVVLCDVNEKVLSEKVNEINSKDGGKAIGVVCDVRDYCVCVSPGPVLTREAMANMKTLLGRAADPQEIVDLCLFIASEKGQFINGENIMIDGGRNAMTRRN